MKLKKNQGSRQAKVPAPCNCHLDVSGGHCQGNGSCDICGPPTQPVSCSANVDGHSLFQLSHPGSQSRITVVTAFPDVGSCSSLKDHMHVHILCQKSLWALHFINCSRPQNRKVKSNGLLCLCFVLCNVVAGKVLGS